MGLIRNHYIGRTFIEPSQAIRNFGVKLKLNPVRGLIEGKRVILVDDSIVRGTTSRKIVRMVREAGATRSPRAHQLPADDFSLLLRRRYTHARGTDCLLELARRNSPVPRRGFARLHFARPLCAKPSNDTEGKFCTSCYTGVYPTDLVQLEVRREAATATPRTRRTQLDGRRSCGEASDGGT